MDPDETHGLIDDHCREGSDGSDGLSMSRQQARRPRRQVYRWNAHSVYRKSTDSTAALT